MEKEKEINAYSLVTPEIDALADGVRVADRIDPQLYTRYDVKRGLRDLNGKGVLAGLTNIAEIRAKKVVDGKEVKMELSVGDRVIMSKYAGTEVKCDGEEYIIVRQNDILAIVE